MSVDSEEDVQGLRRAGQVVRLVLEAMRRKVRPGVTTAELDAVAARVLAANGARHAPRYILGFPADSCISVNDEAVHGIPGQRVVLAGDLVKLDVVAEKDGYMADAAVTVVVPPTSGRKQGLADSARAAFDSAMQVVRAGSRVSDVGRAIETEVRRRGFAVLRELTGHGIGRAIHEPPSIPNHYDWRSRDVLMEGMVITVEPIVAERETTVVEDEDGWTLRTANGSLSAHYEQTLIVTRGRPILLTA